MNELLLLLFGAIGGALYSFPMYIAAISLVPPGRFALAIFIFSIFVGAVMAPVFVPMLAGWKPWLVQPSPYPLSVATGLVANPLVPIFVKKVTGWAERFNPEGVK